MRNLLVIGATALVACVLMLLPLRAFAYGTVPPTQQATYTWATGSNVGPFTSRGAAISAWITQSNTSNPCGAITYSFYDGVVNGNRETIRIAATVGSQPVGNTCVYNTSISAPRDLITGTGPASCPPDSTLQPNSTCLCNAGFKPSGNSCVVINCQSEAGGVGNNTLTWTGNTSFTCYKGCKMECTVRGYQSSTNTSNCSGQFVFTGSEACQGSGSGAAGTGTDAGTTTNPQTCSPGKCPGTVNGLPVCVACTVNTQGPSNTASAPPGSTPPTLPNAPPGAVSSQDETSCTGTSCITRTTYRDAGGNIVGTNEKSQDMPSFCSQNPQHPMCKGSTISGTCSAVQCDGDAVQCAIAKEQAARNCEFFAPNGSSAILGASTETAGNRPNGHPAGAPDAVAVTFASTLDQTNRLAGSCPADISLQMMGQSYTLALSKVCAPAQMVGQVVVGFCLLAAAFIVFRG